MPRRHGRGRGTKGFGTQFNKGSVSGVTFVTKPSGVTIAKNLIQTAGVTITPSGVSAQQLYSPAIGAYALYSLTDGVVIKSGVTRTKGGSSQVFNAGAAVGNQFTLGMTTVINMIANIHLESGVSAMFGIVETDTTGSAATVHYMIGGSGATYASAVTINYVAIGT